MGIMTRSNRKVDVAGFAGNRQLFLGPKMRSSIVAPFLAVSLPVVSLLKASGEVNLSADPHK